MVDILYRFNVLNTAFSVIGSEIKAKFGQVGGCWHLCLFAWTLFFGLKEVWMNTIDYDLQDISGCVFLVTSKYLLFMENVVQRIKFLRFLDFKIFRKIATLAMNISIFPVLWFFALMPCYQGISSTVMVSTGKDGYKYSSIITFIVMLALSALVGRFWKRSSGTNKTSSGSNKTRTRPPSARIIARQNQTKQTRPSSATPVSSKKS